MMDVQEAPIRQQPLSQQIEQILVERIHSGTYPPDTRLPAEVDLAAEFKVSRATIRSALSTLSTLGLLVRRHGAGTFVTRLPRISDPLDQAIEFQELISAHCCYPTIEYVYTGLEPAGTAIAAALQIPGDATVLVSHKVFKADDEPMIYCINTLPASLFSAQRLEEMAARPELLEPIFQILEAETGVRVEYIVAHVRPATARKCRFHIPLPVPAQTPVLAIDEVSYTAEGRPVFHTLEYHPENKMSFSLIRRRLRH
jgi:GntR family transcriptional regulator